MDIDDLDKLFVAIGRLKSEEKIFLKGKIKGECIFGIGNETRIKMWFDCSNWLIRNLIENDMSEFKRVSEEEKYYDNRYKKINTRWKVCGIIFWGRNNKIVKI